MKNVADATPESVRLDFGNILAVQQDGSRVRLDKAVDHLEGGGFARAGSAQKHQQLTGLDGERERVDRLELPEALADLTKLYQSEAIVSASSDVRKPEVTCLTRALLDALEGEA